MKGWHVEADVGVDVKREKLIKRWKKGAQKINVRKRKKIFVF